MKIIIGLGNPGKDYENTRHNAGFMVMDALAKKCNLEFNKEKFSAYFAKGKVKGEDVILLKPVTFMNNSGFSLRQCLDFYKETMENVLVIYDDKDLIDEEEQIPEKLETILRPYQKTGYKWLKTLDRYKFGGILADDMGLGKTIQIISILLDYKQNSEEHRASIVVSPSSLSLNWKNEIEKFAPSLNIKVVRGTVGERKEIIQNIDKYDLVITSYDL